MGAGRIKCPACLAYLSVPEDVRNRMVSCSLCRHVFKLPRRIAVPDDTIFSWLYTPPEQEEDSAETLEQAAVEEPSGGEEGAPLAGAAKQKARPADGRHSLRIATLGRRGAMFEFSAELLKRWEFRCAMPRVCVHCLGRAHLAAHLVMFATRLRDSISLEAEHQAGPLSIAQDALRDLHGQALLKALPKVPNVRPPGDLPLPYWLCDLCSGAGEISGQIEVNPRSGRGLCRLYIRNLQVAASFFASAGGEGTADYERVRRFLRHLQEDHWDALPSVVRHRVEQWCRLLPEERFLAYIPDRDFARTEDGMAGMVVTDRRLVCHRGTRHQEAPVATELLLEVRQAGDKEIVTLDAPNCRQRQMAVDRSGLRVLRQALNEGHFRATWR